MAMRSYPLFLTRCDGSRSLCGLIHHRWMADDRRARRRGGALWFEPRRLVCARIRTRDARDDAPSAITQSIVRSIAHRSINKKSTHKTVSLLTPRRRRRRRRVSRDACESYARHHLAHVFSRSSVVVTMHASIRARHHASSFHQSPRVPSARRRRRVCLQRDACDGIEPLMSPALAFFRGSTRARRSPVASVLSRVTRERVRARDRDWTGQRRRRRRARSTTRSTRETWWWGLVLIPRARRSSSRRRRCVGGADSIRACVRCHAKSIVVVDAVRACGGVCVRGVVARGWGRRMRAWCA